MDSVSFLRAASTSFNCRSATSYLTPSGASGVIVDFDRLEINASAVTVSDLTVKLNGLDTGIIKANNTYMYQVNRTGAADSASIATSGKAVTLSLNNQIRATTQPAADPCVYRFSLINDSVTGITLVPDK